LREKSRGRNTERKKSFSAKNGGGSMLSATVAEVKMNKRENLQRALLRDLEKTKIVFWATSNLSEIGLTDVNVRGGVGG